MNRLLAAVAVIASSPLFAADPPKPVPPPMVLPVVNPYSVVPLTNPKPIRNFLALPEVMVTTAAKGKPVGELFCIVQVVGVQVPHDFNETAGLAVDPKKPTHQWSLTKREAKLLTALLAADKRCELLTAPQLQLTDAQTGFFQVEQNYDVLGPLTVTEEKGEKVVKGKITQQTAGITLRLTPTIAADAKAMTLKAELQYACFGGQQVAVPTTKTDGSIAHTSLTLASFVDLGNGMTGRTFDTQSIATSLSFTPGETVVLGGLSAHGKATGEKPNEVLFLVQGAIGQGTKK